LRAEINLSWHENERTENAHVAAGERKAIIVAQQFQKRTHLQCYFLSNISNSSSCKALQIARAPKKNCEICHKNFPLNKTTKKERGIH
jgi:hypothetical protein